MLYTHAEFQIQGYVGRRTELGGGKVLKVSIAATDSWRDKDSGELRERTDWNTVTLFERTPGFDWLKENLKTGDLVNARGRGDRASRGDTPSLKPPWQALLVIPAGRAAAGADVASALASTG